MRILIVTDSYPPLIGGGTRASQQLARQLRISGHTVTVATAWQRGLPATESDSGVAVHRLRGLVSRVPAFSADPLRYTPPPFPDPELVWRLRRLIRRFEPDLIHTYGWLTYSCLLARIGIAAPLVLAVRDYGNICALRTMVRQLSEGTEPCSGPGWGKCLACAGRVYGEPKGIIAVISVLGQRRSLRRRARAVQSVSRYCARVMQQHLLGPNGPLQTVLPDFREDGLLGAPQEEILSQLPSEPFILFVGAFRRIKGDVFLLDAYRKLINPPPLVMVGSRTAEPLPDFPAGITALVDVPHSTVMAIWDRAAFGVCPSQLSEPLGNTVHEGLSRGKAVIGTKPSGHEDMIEHESTGLLVPIGDGDALKSALEQLIADPAACRRMGAEGRSRVAAFSVETVMPKIETFLAAVDDGG